MDGTVLVADDDKTIRTVLTQALVRAGCKVQATASLITLMRWISEGKGNLVISDIIMPDGNGLDLLPDIRKMRPDLPIIIISAQNSFTTAIKVEKEKAFDYLPKPFDLPELMSKVSSGLKTVENISKAKLPKLREDLPLIGSSPIMLDLYRNLAKIMNLDDTVFIVGETGTGKTLIAKTIHSYSDRRTLNLIVADPDDLISLESSINLAKKTKGGTLIIEDVNLLNEFQQSNLSTLLDSELGDNPRFLITSRLKNHLENLSDNIEPSLLYRLNRYTIKVPPLRFKIMDIDALVEHFLNRDTSFRGQDLKFDRSALFVLKNYFWPGNIRQLENVLYSLLFHTQSNIISADHLNDVLKEQPKDVNFNEYRDKLSDAVSYHLDIYFERHGDMLPPVGLYKSVMKEVESPLIRLALKACNGNQLTCARLLGINRNTLRKKIIECDINVTKNKKMM